MSDPANPIVSGGATTSSDLPLRSAKLRPLQLRKDDVFGACHKQGNTVEVHGTPAAKFFYAEMARFTKDEVDFPPSREIDDVEQRLLLVCLP